MNRLRRAHARFIAYVWDNPTAEADARSILTSPKVAGLLGLEVVVIFLVSFLGFLVLPGEERIFREILAVLGSGPYLIASVFLTVTCFVTLIVPMRASGLLEGPRWRGYLDQLITTGVSPMRYYAGKWATSQPFFLALLGASLPFVFLFGILGGADWGRVLLTYLLLYAYCNLVLAVACGLGAVVHEVAAGVLTYALFVTSGILALTPTPSVLASLTPLRYLVQPLVEPLAGANTQAMTLLYGAARPFGLEIAWPLFALGLWACIGAIVAVTCLLGPLHAFVPGLNNFGAVVLHGDRKKVFFRRFRPILTRRVELAFMFENRGPLLVRWTLPLRALQQLVLLGLVATALFAVLFEPEVVKETPLRAVLVFHVGAVSVVLLLALFAFSAGRVQALRRFDLGPFSVPLVAFDAAAFIIFLGLLVLLHLIGFSTSWEALGMSRTFRWGVATPDELLSRTSAVMAVLLAVGCSAFLVIKVVGTEWLGKGWVYWGGIGYLMALFVFPTFAFGLSEAVSRADSPDVRQLATPFFVLAQFSPGVQMMVILDGVPRRVHSTSVLVRHGFWFWQALLIPYLVGMVWVTQRSIRREAEILESPDPYGAAAAAGHTPCGACGSPLAVPVSWTWWGGIAGARLLGFVRCLDCRKEYRAQTGQPAPFVASLVLMGRMFIGALIAFLGVVALMAATS